MFQVRIDGVLNRCVLVEVVLVDDGVRLCDLLFIRAGPAFQVSLLLALLDRVEKVVALLTELHSGLLSLTTEVSF